VAQVAQVHRLVSLLLQAAQVLVDHTQEQLRLLLHHKAILAALLDMALQVAQAA
jgi:hypothetical protein